MKPSSAIVKRVDPVFADMDMPQHPGAALLVIDHDEIVYRKCYGLADLETQRPITADSSFYLASSQSRSPHWQSCCSLSRGS